MKQDTFSNYHPIVNLYYFLFVFLVSMFFMHPVYLGIGILSGTIYEGIVSGIKNALKNFLKITFPIMVLIAIINPLFNHYGVTILFYLDNGNPITLESIVYGLIMAMMFCSVMVNFRCFNFVMTTDKIMYLFGRILPSVSLIISIVIRFIPEFMRRQQTINNSQKGIGRDYSTGKFLDKMKHGITILSILITWSMENAIITADSMKSRGYGSKKRTAFSIYRLEKRDKLLLIIFTVLAGIFINGLIKGQLYVEYNPVIKISGLPIGIWSIPYILAYVCFCFMPVIVYVIEIIKWKKIQGKIKKTDSITYRLWELQE